MREAIKTIEEVLTYYSDRLEHTKLPEDEMLEIDLWSRVYHLRATIKILEELSNDPLGPEAD